MIHSDDLIFFKTVAASDSLAAAARALNVTAPAVTQRLRQLEARLSVQLVHRGSRGISLTSDGELIADRGRAILGAMDELSDVLSERRNEVTGQLALIAPLGFGRRYIAPVVATFQTRHPSVQVELLLTDRPASTLLASCDLAIHLGSLAEVDPTLTVRQLAPNERIMCASPAYVAERGRPQTPADLKGHACIALRENEEDVTLWRMRPKAGKAWESLRIAPSLASNDGEVVKAWAVAGRGVIVRSEWDVAEDLRAGRLVRVLPDYEMPAAPVVVLISGRREARTARTRRFLDFLAGTLDPPEWRRGD